MKDFIEYIDNGDFYREPKRQEVQELIEIRVYCEHEGCNKYIIGNEGYNGKFIAETGQQADLRNDSWFCKRHEPENIENNDAEVSLIIDPILKKPEIKLSRYEYVFLVLIVSSNRVLFLCIHRFFHQTESCQTISFLM